MYYHVLYCYPLKKITYCMTYKIIDWLAEWLTDGQTRWVLETNPLFKIQLILLVVSACEDNTAEVILNKNFDKFEELFVSMDVLLYI